MTIESATARTGRICATGAPPIFRAAWTTGPLFALLVGCSSHGSTPRLDAGPEAKEQVDAPVQPPDGRVDMSFDLGPFDLWAGSCDPAEQNCGAGKACVIGCDVPGVMRDEFTCIDDPMGTAGHGEDCTGAMCKAGSICIGDDKGGGAHCRQYCNADADCPAGKECTISGSICKKGDYPMGRLCAL